MQKNQQGFSLVELMVVILIIALLLAAAIPRYVGVRDRAYNSDAQQSIFNAARIAVAFYASERAYPTAQDLNDEAEGYDFIDSNEFPLYQKPPLVAVGADHYLRIRSQSGKGYRVSINKGIVGKTEEINL